MTAAIRAVPRVLSIAGTDPTGGAGVPADLKSIAANGGYGMAVVTALVAQNTRGVRSVHLPPVEFLVEQLDSVSDDVEIDAVKVGMLGTAPVIRAVQEWLDRVRPPLVVIDPVMVATSGDRLLDADAEHALRELLTRADLVTPNVVELAVLADGAAAGDWNAVLDQARRLADRYAVAVLAKGGHMEGDTASDALVDADGVREFAAPRVRTDATHGTGCSLSAAIATRRASGMSWPDAVQESKRWLTESLRTGRDLAVGHGHGPIDHFAGLWTRGGLTTRPTPAEVAAGWWDDVREIRDEIEGLPFVRGLAEGTLDHAAFIRYLRQDARYLSGYARVLAAASRLAPDPAAQEFWARGAYEALRVELRLHRDRISADTLTADTPHPATTAYLSHLDALSDRGDYGILVAAVLPCYWLYRDLGSRLAAAAAPDHPYADWIAAYSGDSFGESSDRAVDIVTRVAATASDTRRRAMQDAFRVSFRHERDFFAAPVEPGA